MGVVVVDDSDDKLHIRSSFADMLPNFYFIIAKIQAFVNEKSPTGRNFPKKEKMSGAWEHTPELVFLFLRMASEYQRKQIAEYDCGRNSACGAGKPACQCADKSFFVHRSFDAHSQ